MKTEQDRNGYKRDCVAEMSDECTIVDQTNQIYVTDGIYLNKFHVLLYASFEFYNPCVT